MDFSGKNELSRVAWYIRAEGRELWVALNTFFFYFHNSRTHFCVNVFCLTLSQMIFFPKLLCPDRESNSSRFSCTSLRNLNSGRFSDWATMAAASFQHLMPNSLLYFRSFESVTASEHLLVRRGLVLHDAGLRGVEALEAQADHPSAGQRQP